MRRGPRDLARLVLLLAVGSPATAGAFCRSRTCDPKLETCTKDAFDCVTSGHELRWSSGCVTFDAQQDGSPKRGIDAETVASIAETAFQTWQNADCGGHRPALEVTDLGPVACSESRFNADARNANIIMFRDDAWPYPASMEPYAQTTVRFNRDTGEIFDADIEINSAKFPLQTTPDGLGLGVDLQSILTHELGHFLGLAHAPFGSDATMRPGWDGRGVDLRTLTADDEAGICDIYPLFSLGAGSCNPLFGFGSGCADPAESPPNAGCTLGGAPARGSSTLAVFAAACALGIARRRRSRRG